MHFNTVLSQKSELFYMKKWVLDPKNPQNRGFWALASKILTYEKPMGSYKVCGAILHSFEAKIRGVVHEKMGI